MGIGDALQHRADRRRRAEEKRADDPVDDDVGIVRGTLVVGLARAVGFVRAVFGHERRRRIDGRRFGHAMDEQRRAERETDHDRLDQIAENGKKKGRQQHRRIAGRSPDQHREGVLLHHIPRDQRQDAGEAGERHVRRQGCGHQDEGQQEHRMQHARDRAMRARAHVRGGARDRAGHADPAE